VHSAAVSVTAVWKNSEKMFAVLADSTEVSRVFKDVSQTTVPFALTVRTACPAGQVPVTRFCLLLTAVAVALKFVFTSAADAGVPVTNVLGTLKACGHASGEARTSDPIATQRAPERRAIFRSFFIDPPKCR
jgi:hypothetical protein